MSWLNALLGKIFSLGVEVPLGKGINFVDNLRAELNPATGYVDVSVEGAQGATGATGPTGPAGPTGPTFAGSTSIIIGADAQRAALTGAITAAQNSNVTALGSVGSTSIVVGADIQRAALTGDVTASQNSNATTVANDAVSNAKLANMASDTVKGNISGSSGDPSDVALSDLDSTSVVYDGTSHTFQRAALTGVVTAAQNSNTTAFAAIAAKSVLANTTNASAVPGASAPGGPLLSLRANGANNALEWAGAAAVSQSTAAAVTAATTILDTTPTYTIPANTLSQGSSFRLEYAYAFSRGGTATALNLSSFLDIATAPSTLQVGPTASGVYIVHVVAMITVTSIGGGGTAMAWIKSTLSNSAASADDIVLNASASFALNTTASNAIRGAAQMSGVVASTSIQALGGHVQRMS